VLSDTGVFLCAVPKQHVRDVEVVMTDGRTEGCFRVVVGVELIWVEIDDRFCDLHVGDSGAATEVQAAGLSLNIFKYHLALIYILFSYRS